MAWAVEMASYWFLCPPVCLPNVLLSALPAFDQVGHVPCLADGCSTYVEGLFRGRILECGAHLDMAAGEAASGATRVASTGSL